MNPDRIVEVRPHRNPVTRVALAGFIAAGSLAFPPLLEKLASWLPTIPTAEAFTPNCRTGLGVKVDNEAFLKGARVIVVEDLNSRRIADGRLRVGEEVLVVFEGPSNATKGGRDARQFVSFVANDSGQRVSSRVTRIVTCGRFEHTSSVVEEEPERRGMSTPSRTATPTPDTRVATLEAQLRGIYATATRTVENEQLASAARAKGEANARATITAEAQATAVVRTLIQEAEKRGRESYIATATAVVSPTAGAAGIRPGDDSKIPSIPWIPLAGGLGILALIGAEFIFQKVRHTTGNIIKFPYRAFRRFILKQAGTQLWP